MLPKCCAASAHLQHSTQSTSPLPAVHGETPPPADKYPARKCNRVGATSRVCRARRGVVQRVGLSPRKTSLYLARGGAAPPAAAIFSLALHTQISTSKTQFNEGPPQRVYTVIRKLAINRRCPDLSFEDLLFSRDSVSESGKL